MKAAIFVSSTLANPRRNPQFINDGMTTYILTIQNPLKSRRALMECGGKRSATPLCNGALFEGVAEATRFLGLSRPPQYRLEANNTLLQSAVDAALCRRTPKGCPIPRWI
jgi:hypothetical protein